MREQPSAFGLCRGGSVCGVRADGARHGAALAALSLTPRAQLRAVHFQQGRTSPMPPALPPLPWPGAESSLPVKGKRPCCSMDWKSLCPRGFTGNRSWSAPGLRWALCFRPVLPSLELQVILRSLKAGCDGRGRVGVSSEHRARSSGCQPFWGGRFSGWSRVSRYWVPFMEPCG